ncbi:hypothetical protein QR680_017906 [Steinernema hermaphroditum]|uniref:Serine protease n=1 Tax=Steinernema hermaphroditum TaxID=289476 RepID=A0AA39HG87_9BILA|nr:hypothetical protein QR680_017906 [Steinernema hermaphroditum]
MRCLAGLLFVALLGLSSAGFRFHESQWRRMNADVHLLPNYDALPYENKTFTQPIDHNNAALGTWEQHFQVMKEYLNKKADSNLVFLMIGGEGPASTSWISNPHLQYIQWAKEYGALCFQVEHRFFGKSRPYNNMTTESLKYLTTQQALADLANFIKSVNNDTSYGLKEPRWITFGGSYPGSLAAWFRSKYPELTVGSVASSAPLNLKLDFYEYTMVMQNTIQNVSQECYDVVNKTFIALQKSTLTTSGRNTLNDFFKKPPLSMSPLFADANVTMLQLTNFLGNIYDVFQGVIQYTYDGRNNVTVGGLNVSAMCDIMTSNKPKNDNNYIQGVVNVLKWNSDLGVNLGGGEPQTIVNDYEASIKPTKSVHYDDPNGDADGRGWMWLCCNELGFMQTTSQGYNIFQDIVPLGFYFQQCVDLFGKDINATYVRDNNRKAQKYYGGVDSFNATNLVLPNGSLDPWHALGFYKADKKNNLQPYLIGGTAHCSDMYPVYDGEPSALKDARKFVHDQLEIYTKIPKKKTGLASSATLSAAVIAIALLVERLL